MTRKYFGTDGIRGTANAHPMTAEVALRVGMAAAAQFTRGNHRHRVIIGKDTRLSGYMLEQALTAGFLSAGMDVVLVGPMPTPAVAMLVQSLRADLGVMISASHNRYHDNGIKLFGPDGYKLSDKIETAIEARMENGFDDILAAPEKLGRARRLDDVQGRYTEYVKRTFPENLTLEGLKVVIDCAHGAAYKVAPEVLWELGAEVIPVGVKPDGFNINDECGSTYITPLRELVVMHGADIGIALDGDADRMLVVDEAGAVVDGDQILGLIATHMHQNGTLNRDTVIATQMSNLGLEKYLSTIGVRMERTAVGDRYVVERMREGGFNLGGEQSGHIILGNHSTTGDGLIAALQVLAVLAGEKKPASALCRVFDAMPQVLKNVQLSGGNPMGDKTVQESIAAGEARLGENGRILIRPSGTEPLIRVMAEGTDLALVGTVVDDIVAAVERAVG